METSPTRKRKRGAPAPGESPILNGSEKRRRRHRTKHRKLSQGVNVATTEIDTADADRLIEEPESGNELRFEARVEPQISATDDIATEPKRKRRGRKKPRGQSGPGEGTNGEDSKTARKPYGTSYSLEDTAVVLASERDSQLPIPRTRKEVVAQREAWDVSQPIGGRTIDTAPVLSSDEQHLVCATEAAIAVYETSSSTLLRELPVIKSFICAFALSAVENHVVWAGTHGGKIHKWNFVDGALLGRWKTEAPIQCLRTIKLSDKQEVIYTLSKKGSWNLTAHYITPDHPWESKTILQNKSAVRSFAVRESGNVIVAITLDSVIVGYASNLAEATKGPEKIEYAWHEVKCSEPPICFDVKVRQRSSKSKGGPARRWNVDVVVGGARGCIYVFDDFLAMLDRIKGADTVGNSMLSQASKQLHWHREAVASVTWSLDGDYIVSGGKETTLVLWQLETGRKQFLPNLESPILNLEVSPNGSSYVVQLADNSVMVLSASELSPTAHVASVQAISFSKVVIPTPRLPTVDLLSQLSVDTSPNCTPAAILPQSPDHILLAVPAHQTSLGIAGAFAPAPYLQDFDISAARFSSRQALTRTNAINVNFGPEGNSILEPDVKFISITQSGKWLATVDEWEPPRKDVQDLAVNGNFAPCMRESKLRIWAWNETDKNWTLNSRIDDPHHLEESHCCVPVLGLASDPSTPKYATVGSDSIVRVWTPKTKLKNGKIVRGVVRSPGQTKIGHDDTWWALDYSVALDRATAFEALHSVAPDRAVLAFSNDGSVLAVHLHHDAFEGAESTVHFIDTIEGVLHESRCGLLETSDGIHGLAFLDRYLICLGREAAAVWDITSFDLHSFTQLHGSRNDNRELDIYDSATAKSKTQTPIPHLAVDLITRTFAIASHEPYNAAHSLAVHPFLKFRTRISIFSPDSGSEPIFETKLPRTTLALLSASGIVGNVERGQDVTGRKRGYVVLDIGAEVRTIEMRNANRKDTTTKITLNGTEPREVLVKIAQQTDDGAQSDDAELEIQSAEEEGALATEDQSQGLAALPKYTLQSEESWPVVRREQLAEAFDYPSLAMPPMKDLFNSVVRLYAGKPTTRSPRNESIASTGEPSQPQVLASGA